MGHPHINQILILRKYCDYCIIVNELKSREMFGTSGVAAREARLHSLSLELLSLSESDSELLSDSLELPDAPLE